MQRYINKIAAGDTHTVWIKPDGTVGACGGNKKGQCNVSGWRNIVSVACGKNHTAGLCSDGTVVACGSSFWDECKVSGWKNIVAIACGWNSTVGIERNGTVHFTGYGLTPADVTALRNSTHISLGDGFAVAVKQGRTQAYGSTLNNRTSGIDKWSDIVYVASGLDHTLGVKGDGQVVGAGYDLYNELTTKSWYNVIRVACGRRHSIGLTSMRTLFACGSNKDGQLNVGVWSDIIEVACGSFHTVGRRADGSLVATGLNKDGQCNVSGVRSVPLSEASGSAASQKPAPTPISKTSIPLHKEDVTDQLHRLQEQRARLEAERLRIAEETERLQALERERLERERIETEERERAERERLERERALKEEQERLEMIRLESERVLAAREQERAELLSVRQAPPAVVEEFSARRQRAEADVERLRRQRNAVAIPDGAARFTVEAESSGEQIELADVEGKNCVIIGKVAFFKETLKSRSSVASRHIALLVRDGRLYIQNLSTISETSVGGTRLKASEAIELVDGDRILIGKNETTGAILAVTRVEEIDPFDDTVDDGIEEEPVSEEQAELDLLRSFAGVSVTKKTPKKETLSDFQYVKDRFGEIVLTKYIGSDAVVKIPRSIGDDDVTTIGTGCFYMNQTVRAVDMSGAGIEVIEKDAFFCCRSLDAVVTSSELFRVGDSAFEGCESLTFIGDSDDCLEFSSRGAHLSLCYLGDKAFRDCRSLPMLDIKMVKDMDSSSDHVELGAEAFSGCIRLESATVSVGTMFTKSLGIAPGVFSGCRALKKLTLPSQTRADFVSEDFLDGCRSLVTVEVGAKSDVIKVLKRMGLAKKVTKIKS